MTEGENPITVSVSIERKIQTAPYENAVVRLSLGNVPVDALDEEIERAVHTGARLYNAIAIEVRERVANIRKASEGQGDYPA